MTDFYGNGSITAYLNDTTTPWQVQHYGDSHARLIGGVAIEASLRVDGLLPCSVYGVDLLFSMTAEELVAAMDAADYGAEVAK